MLELTRRMTPARSSFTRVAGAYFDEELNAIKGADKERQYFIMPNIKPISELRNYTDVLKEVDTSSRVYLTRNGHGEYGILTMAEIDELDRYRAAYTLFSKDTRGRS